MPFTTCTSCGKSILLPPVEDSLWVDCPYCDAEMVHPEAAKQQPADSRRLENLRHGGYALMLMGLLPGLIVVVLEILSLALQTRQRIPDNESKHIVLFVVCGSLACFSMGVWLYAVAENARLRNPLFGGARAVCSVILAGLSVLGVAFEVAHLSGWLPR